MEHLTVEEVEHLIAGKESSDEDWFDELEYNREVEECGGFFNYMMKNETGW